MWQPYKVTEPSLLYLLSINSGIIKSCLEGPFHQWFSLPKDLNDQEFIICYNLPLGMWITTKFCTCHDSCAVVACAKFCNDHIHTILMRVKNSLPSLNYKGKISLVKSSRPPEVYNSHGLFSSVYEAWKWTAVNIYHIIGNVFMGPILP